MVSFNKSTASHDSILPKFAIVAILLSIAPTARVAPAQDHYYGSSTTSLESSFNWSWWHGMYFHANGSPRYGSGFVNSTRNTQYRLPVNPPICGPSYGYYQSCWKQMAVVRRCVTCETFTVNREIPNANTTQLPQIPPAPEETEKTEKTEETDTKNDMGAENPEQDSPEPNIPSP